MPRLLFVFIFIFSATASLPPVLPQGRLGMLFSQALPGAALAAPAQNDPALSEKEAGQPTSVPGYSMDDFRKLADAIERTGVNTDNIPALYRPSFVTVSDASLSMDDDEVVFIVHYPNGRIRIYPQRILVWHEVVNDVLPDASGRMPPRPVPGVVESAGESYSITYSPLTGAVTGFRSTASGYPTIFGVTGNILNGNTVLYDRISGSLWSQLLAACIEGPFRGKRLERIPVLWARWGGVKHRYSGKAEVLSRSTGYKRNYGKDPYGSYQIKGNYYDDVRLMVILSRLDRRLPPKKRILGLEDKDLYGAVQVDAVREARVLNFTMGLTPMAAFYDADIDAVRIFDRRPGGPNTPPLNFLIFEDKLVDEQTRSEWLPTGASTYGRYRDKNLSPVLAVDSMWYAWAAFHRETEVFPPLQNP